MSKLELFLLIVAALVLFYRPTKRQASGPGVKPAGSAAPSRLDGTHHWPSGGQFEVEVVGESFHQAALTKLARHDAKITWETRVVAELVPENNNPHDDQAVAVRIDGPPGWAPGSSRRENLSEAAGAEPPDKRRDHLRCGDRWRRDHRWRTGMLWGEARHKATVLIGSTL